VKSHRANVSRRHAGPGRSVLVPAAFALLVATGAQAQNLLPNGEFDLDLLGWATAGSGSAIAWNGLDHSSCPPSVSGSLLHTNSSTSAGVERGTATCMTDVVADAVYSFGADLLFPTGQTRSGSARIVVVWFTTPDCSGLSGNTSEGDQVVTTAAAGNWVRVRNDAATAPLDAMSASFVIRLTKTEAGGSLALHDDGAYMVDGLTFLFNDDFERESSCHWSQSVP
jgi:hypothetical protein